MNTPDNVSEVEKYLTPQLYNELKSIITSNDYVADFNPLDCRLIDSSIENNNYIASVHFYGKVSDSPSSPSEDFNEIWHFIKPLNQQNAKWVVAGIQQTN
jgi:predicted lipid-binding transport protein (Tim44 family)